VNLKSDIKCSETVERLCNFLTFWGQVKQDYRPTINTTEGLTYARGQTERQTETCPSQHAAPLTWKRLLKIVSCDWLRSTPTTVSDLVQFRGSFWVCGWNITIYLSRSINIRFRLSEIHLQVRPEISRQIFALDGSNDMDWRKGMRFRGFVDINYFPFTVQIPKIPIGEAWIDVLTPNAPNNGISAFQNCCIDRNVKNFEQQYQVGLLFVGSLIRPQTNPIWRTTATLKNRKIARTPNK